MDEEGPMRGMKNGYVFGLSKEEVSRMSREDDAVGELREKLEAEIVKLEGAREIAQEARDKIGALKVV